VNEDDEKLNTSIIEEEDQRSILIIGEFKYYSYQGQGEANICVEDAAAKGHPAETVMEEKEQILKSSQ
jgi:hypothetical protein